MRYKSMIRRFMGFLSRRVFSEGFRALAAVACIAAAHAPAAARASRKAPAAINLVFDGDSISAGFGATQGHGLAAQVEAALGGRLQVHNVAVIGRPVSECLRLYRSLVGPLFVTDGARNIIVFHAGDNDIAQGRDAASTYAAFTDYVAQAHRQGWLIVVSTELRRPDFSPGMEAALEGYNRRLRGNAAGADAVVDLDADPRLADLSWRQDPALFSADHMHPSDGGYAVLASMLVPPIRRLAAR